MELSSVCIKNWKQVHVTGPHEQQHQQKVSSVRRHPSLLVLEAMVTQLDPMPACWELLEAFKQQSEVILLTFEKDLSGCCQGVACRGQGEAEKGKRFLPEVGERVVSCKPCGDGDVGGFEIYLRDGTCRETGCRGQ